MNCLRTEETIAVRIFRLLRLFRLSGNMGDNDELIEQHNGGADVHITCRRIRADRADGG